MGLVTSPGIGEPSTMGDGELRENVASGGKRAVRGAGTVAGTGVGGVTGSQF